MRISRPSHAPTTRTASSGIRCVHDAHHASNQVHVDQHSGTLNLLVQEADKACLP